MKSAIVLAAVLAQLAVGQATLDYESITNAPAPTATGVPQVVVIDEDAISASLVEVVTAAAAEATSAPAKFRLKREANPEANFINKHKPKEDLNSLFCRKFPWNLKCLKQESKPWPLPPKPKWPKWPVVNPPHNPKPPTTPKPPIVVPPVTPPPQDNQCTAQEVGAGPVPTPDTPAAFRASTVYSEAALGAATPSGYLQTFQNLNAAYSGFSYISFSNLDSYDVETCSGRCDETEGCSSFNIYFERSPTLAPGPNCPNPPSSTFIRCALWGSAIDAAGATNRGQFRQEFEIVIAGSNGYSKPGAPIDVPDYSPPDKCDGTPDDKGKPWWIGDHFFPGFFAPKFCKIFADIQELKNQEDARSKGLTSYTAVNGFNAFEVWEEGKMIGTYCKLYSDYIPIDWHTWKGETKLGKLWEVKNAWFYKIINKKFGNL